MLGVNGGQCAGPAGMTDGLLAGIGAKLPNVVFVPAQAIVHVVITWFSELLKRGKVAQPVTAVTPPIQQGLTENRQIQRCREQPGMTGHTA